MLLTSAGCCGRTRQRGLSTTACLRQLRGRCVRRCMACYRARLRGRCGRWGRCSMRRLPSWKLPLTGWRLAWRPRHHQHLQQHHLHQDSYLVVLLVLAVAVVCCRREGSRSRSSSSRATSPLRQGLLLLLPINSLGSSSSSRWRLGQCRHQQLDQQQRSAPVCCSSCSQAQALQPGCLGDHR